MVDSELLHQYDLGRIINIKKDSVGTGENYVIEADAGKFFVKTFDDNDAFNNPFLEVSINDTLKKSGIPVVEFVRNKQNSLISSSGSRIMHVQKFIPGTIFGNHSLPGDLLIKSGEMLGKIHKALRGFEFKKDFSFIKKVADVNKNIAAHEALYDIIQHSKAARDEKIKTDLRYKINMLHKYSTADLYSSFSRLTHNLTHGDYNCCQFIIQGNEIAAVVDFSRVAYLPVIWEIGRSYSISNPACRDGDINLGSFDKYLDAHQKHFNLPNSERNYVWEFYKLQLLGSNYGYREYVYGNNDRLLDFAFWRTNLVKSLESKKGSAAKSRINIAQLLDGRKDRGR